MKYSINQINKANKIIDERRANALKSFENNKKIAYSKIPMLYEIDSELSSSGIQISREIMSNKSDSKAIIEKIKNRNKQLIDKKKSLLVENGFEKNFLSIPYNCKKCNDTGYVDAMPCSCLSEILNKIIIEESKNNSATKTATFDNFNLEYYPEDINGVPCKEIMTQSLNSCKEYAENFSKSSPSIYLFGTTGIGKTHISQAIANVVAKNGHKVIYMSAPDLFTMLEKERFNNESPIENMQNLTECDLLIIDDLGTEFSTSFTTSALYNIINTRILLDLPTIISANLYPSELLERYSDRIYSRIIGCFEHLHFVGKDIRIIKKKSLL